jgi:hypothetical protein
MPDLAGRGPLGPKPDKPEKRPRKGIPPISKKRAAAMASKAWRDGIEHMARVKLLPCICCGHPPPSYAHHVTGDGMPRNHMRVLPLCYACHQGPHGYHAAKAAWVERYGPDYTLLPRVDEMLKRME